MALFDRHNSRLGAEKKLLLILERERQAILEGHFDILKSLEAKKEYSLRAFSRCASLPALQNIRDELARNQKMLEAAGRGIESAHKILSRASAGRSSFSTYDAEGNRAVPTSLAKTLERRA